MMSRRVSTILMAGILTAAGAAVVVLPMGCQSENQVAATETSVVCPVCQRETRIQPLTGLKYTTCICPTCKTVSTLDPEFRDRLEVFYGNIVGDAVPVCDTDETVVMECAVCREARHARGL
jgi:hypothetical protein